LFVKGKDLTWVGASGLLGVRSVTVDLKEPAKYRLKFVFLEPEHTEPGNRIFNLRINGSLVIENLDIVKAAGARDTVYTKTIDNVTVSGTLKIEFKAVKGKSLICGLEIVRE
jgi:hypothetical protein